MCIATRRDTSSGLMDKEQWPFILVDELFFVLPTQKADDEVDKVAERASGMGVYRQVSSSDKELTAVGWIAEGD